MNKNIVKLHVKCKEKKTMELSAKRHLEWIKTLLNAKKRKQLSSLQKVGTWSTSPFLRLLVSVWSSSLTLFLGFGESWEDNISPSRRAKKVGAFSANNSKFVQFRIGRDSSWMCVVLMLVSCTKSKYDMHNLRYMRLV